MNRAERVGMGIMPDLVSQMITLMQTVVPTTSALRLFQFVSATNLWESLGLAEQNTSSVPD